MVMTGHDHKRQERVTLAGEVQKCVLDNLRLPVVGEVAYRAVVVQQFVHQRKQQLVLVTFPLLLRETLRTRPRIEFQPILPDAFHARGRDAAIQAGRNKDRLPFHVPVRQVSSPEDAVVQVALA